MRRIFVRKQMRKAYNSGEFEKALEIASKNTDCKINGVLSKSIIVRLHWKNGEFQEVIDLLDKYPEAEVENLKQKAIHKLKRIRTYEKKSDDSTKISRDNVDPTPANKNILQHVYDPENLTKNWFQESAKLWFRHPNGWVYWDMPEGFNLDRTHPALVELATDVLLRPWNEEVKKPITKGREFGKKLALSYSGGIDSTAAALLLPNDTILGYNERSFTSMLDHRNAFTLFEAWREKLGRDVLRVPSNHEIIRTFHDKQDGFSTDYASGVHLILLADMFNLGGIAFGVPIDNTWLQKGKWYRDFSQSSHWKLWSNRFREAGLELVLPINHISEAGALRVCEKSPLIDEINSCMRGDGVNGCGKCWKCFHKNGPLGREVDLNSKEISKFLTERPMRTAQHALWAVQILGVEDIVPDLSEHLEKDLSWWEKAYPKGLELIPQNHRDFVEHKTNEYLQWMDDVTILERTNLFPKQ